MARPVVRSAVLGDSTALLGYQSDPSLVGPVDAHCVVGKAPLDEDVVYPTIDSEVGSANPRAAVTVNPAVGVDLVHADIVNADHQVIVVSP